MFLINLLLTTVAFSNPALDRLNEAARQWRSIYEKKSEDTKPNEKLPAYTVTLENDVAIDPAIKWISFSFEEPKSHPDIRLWPGPGVGFNYAYPWCWLMGSPNTSHMTFYAKFSKADIKKDWYLNIKQLSSIAGSNYSPVAIDINGVNIADHFEPLRDAWRIDHFKLQRKLLREGENTIKLRLQNAYTNYWIEHLSLSPKEPAYLWILYVKENN